MFNLDYCGFLLCVLTLIGVQWHLPPSSICQSECWVVFLSRGEASFGANCWIRWEIVVAPACALVISHTGPPPHPWLATSLLLS